MSFFSSVEIYDREPNSFQNANVSSCKTVLSGTAACAAIRWQSSYSGLIKCWHLLIWIRIVARNPFRRLVSSSQAAPPLPPYASRVSGRHDQCQSQRYFRRRQSPPRCLRQQCANPHWAGSSAQCTGSPSRDNNGASRSLLLSQLGRQPEASVRESIEDGFTVL